MYDRQAAPNGLVIDIAWSPAANLLAWTDMTGALVRWTDPVPTSRPSPFSISSSKPNGTASKPKKSDLEALLDDDEGDDTAMDGDDAGDKDMMDDDEDWVVNDLGDEFTAKERFNEGVTREMVNVTKAQPAFQPGSTPFRGKKRYLGEGSAQ